MHEKLNRAASELVESYSREGVKIHHLDRRPLPSRAEVVRVLDALQELLFPGYAGAQGLTGAGLRLHTEARLAWLYAHGEVIERADEDEVIRFTVRLRPADRHRFERDLPRLAA